MGFFSDLFHFRVPVTHGNLTVLMVILNFVPFCYGVGTIIAGFQTNNRNAKIIGGLQFMTSFVFIGIIWSAAYGVLLVKHSGDNNYYAIEDNAEGDDLADELPDKKEERVETEEDGDTL
eukprot:gnl/Chilomastix_caulleri/167.p1 GENE.gnl/Chilomastix_caulleri/167~~gnl/Chilomastix_caulleri/167.p1  ORF type:complete len:119 (+),score=2.67 gnl/Chilomastix_caulleri/167:87-443(+)